MTLQPTPEQHTIIEAVAFGQTLKVAALAGTGKTSTLVMIAHSYPSCRGLYLTYNKALQLEAMKKFPDWIECKTIHGLAYGKFGRLFRSQLMTKLSPQELGTELEIEDFTAQFKIDGENLTITESVMLGWTRDIVRHFMFSNRKTIELDDVVWFIKAEVEKEYPDLKKDESFYQTHKNLVQQFYTNLNACLLSYARCLWEKQSDVSNEDVPAEHDTYLKLYQLSKPLLPKYDYIMLDEAQDANPCIIDILSNQSCQVIYVGDEYQQIYAFRGNVNAMRSIEATTYPLTQSFRFGDAIANQANLVLEQLNSSSRILGLASIGSLLEDVQTPYTFIGRTNARILEECVAKIEEGYKCCFAGDMKSLISLIKSIYFLWCKHPEWVIDNRVSCFADWDELILFAREHEDQELLMPISFILKHGGDTLSKMNLVEREAKYKELEADIILTTAHKAKGREWNRVILGDDFSLKEESEMNIYYVALTRAKHVLQHTFPMK